MNEAAKREAAKNASRFALYKPSYVSEIKYIQAQLKDGEWVGYIMLNDAYNYPLCDRTHLDIVVIAKDKIIKPLSWIVEEVYELSEKDLPAMYKMVLNLNSFSPLDKASCKFLRTVKNPRGFILPQLGNIVCGTLIILYLKELLKENARQLEKFTLIFSYYAYKNEDEYFSEYNPDEENLLHKKINLFFPPPCVLRYSESSLYNAVITNMLMSDEDQGIVQHNGKTLKFMSLKKILLDSIQIAENNNDMTTVNENQKILNNLPEFRKKWFCEYQLAKEKRDTMSSQKGSKNLYLEYKSRRFEQIKFKPTVELTEESEKFEEPEESTEESDQTSKQYKA